MVENKKCFRCDKMFSGNHNISTLHHYDSKLKHTEFNLCRTCVAVLIRQMDDEQWDRGNIQNCEVCRKSLNGSIRIRAYLRVETMGNGYFPTKLVCSEACYMKYCKYALDHCKEDDGPSMGTLMGLGLL